LEDDTDAPPQLQRDEFFNLINDDGVKALEFPSSINLELIDSRFSLTFTQNFGIVRLIGEAEATTHPKRRILRRPDS